MKRKLALMLILAAFASTLLFVFLDKNKYDFKLQGLDKSYSLKDFKGQNLIIYFGYMLCPDVCPTTLMSLADVLGELEAKNSRVIFISIDPEREKIEELQEWLEYFYKPSTALLPSLSELESVAGVYGALYERVELPSSELKYSMAHSSELYVIDARGKFKGKINNLSKKNLREKLLGFLGEKL